MGKVKQFLAEIREYTNIELIKRYEKTVSAKAVRNYLAMERNSVLDVEVGLLEEELYNRLSVRDPLYVSAPYDKLVKKKKTI